MSWEAKQVDWTRAALLAVWNPRVGPDTIGVHVEQLRAPVPDGALPWTWWGRIYAGGRRIEELGQEWPWYSAISNEVARRGHVTLYATSFESLHALRIDRLQFEPPDDGRVPAYYVGKRVGLWFRVRDIKALQWSSYTVAEALDGLSPIHVGPDRRTFERRGTFDLYAAIARFWPIAVEVLSEERVGGIESSEPGQEFFRRAGVSRPQVIEQARAVLQRKDPELWAAFDEGVRESIATAHFLADDQRMRSLDGAHLTMACARAVELLGVQLCSAARELLDARGRGEALREALAATNGWKGQAEGPTLGQLGHSWSQLRGQLEAVGIAVPPFDRAKRFVAEFPALRNDAAHGRPVDEAKLRELHAELHDAVLPEFVRLRARLEAAR